MDATAVARELLDPLPANRTLAITVVEAVDGHAVVSVDASPALSNVIGALHSSALTGLLDAAGLAAIVSVAPSAEAARSLQPLGVAVHLEFRRPVRGAVHAACTLTNEARAGLVELFDGRSHNIRCRTEGVIHSVDSREAVTGGFEWSIRLAQT